MIKMSILNHFGKVKASYKKYESELTEYKGYVHVRFGKYSADHPACGTPQASDLEQLMMVPLLDNGKCIYNGEMYNGGEIVYGEPFKRKKFIVDIKLIQQGYLKQIINASKIKNPCGSEISHFSIRVSNTYNPSISPEAYVFSFTTLVETFSKCLEKVREKLSSEFWKTIEFCPLINIIDLLILKHSDTDKHIEHLEEIVKALIDDNKLLQTKINTLESQMSLFKLQPERMIDDKLLQRIESTILKQNDIDMQIQRRHSTFMEKIGLLEKEITTLKNIPTAVAVQSFSVGEEMLKDSRF